MKPLLPTLASIIMATVAQAQIPIAPDAKLTLASDGYLFTEGPAADSEGNVYFTDQPNDRILKWTAATGKTETFLHPSGRSNGLYIDYEGDLIACADEHSQLWKIDVDTKQKEILLDNFRQKLLNGPNDLWIDPAGGIYFTDPFYKRKYWENRRGPEQTQKRVYYLPKGARTAVIAAEGFTQPNGIIGTSDGKLLYVADPGASKTYSYEIAADHTLSNPTLFAETGSDGMTLDSSGNLYITRKAVLVFDKTGKELGTIAVPERGTTNVTFGGKDHKTLFITAMDSVYTLKMAISGQ